MTNPIVIGIDAGGTMTDTILVDERGHFKIGKAATTPKNEADGFIASAEDAADAWGLSLDELFGGPLGDLDEALPEGAELTGVRLEGDQVVVDVSRAFATDLPAGSSAEMLAVYSIINSVCFNYPQIARVWITVEGNQKTVLKHLDLSDPLPPDYSLEHEAASTNSAAPVTPPPPAAKKGHP